jgi:hypothetical protein
VAVRTTLTARLPRWFCELRSLQNPRCVVAPFVHECALLPFDEISETTTQTSKPRNRRFISASIRTAPDRRRLAKLRIVSAPLEAWFVGHILWIELDQCRARRAFEAASVGHQRLAVALNMAVLARPRSVTPKPAAGSGATAVRLNVSVCSQPPRRVEGCSSN